VLLLTIRLIIAKEGKKEGVDLEPLLPWNVSLG
jgi:hypothetical protein